VSGLASYIIGSEKMIVLKRDVKEKREKEKRFSHFPFLIPNKHRK